MDTYSKVAIVENFNGRFFNKRVSCVSFSRDRGDNEGFINLGCDNGRLTKLTKYVDFN